MLQRIKNEYESNKSNDPRTDSVFILYFQITNTSMANSDTGNTETNTLATHAVRNICGKSL